jgi:long-chain-alcohol oxidase
MTSSAVDPGIDPILRSLARGVLGDSYVPEVAERIRRSIELVPSEVDRKQLAGTLKALGTKLGALALTGRPVPVPWLDATEAEALVNRWRLSRLPQQRRLSLWIRTSAAMALYSYPGPLLDKLGYLGPLGEAPDEPKHLDPVVLERDEVLTCDAVIVGSGAGGGCTAAVLAAAGLDVIVVEKGGYNSESNFHHREADANRELYLYGQRLATTDLGCQILAGSTLGGGTVVNYTTSFKTPPHVLREWAQISGVEAFASGEIEESLDVVSERLGVNTDSSAAGKRDELMEEGLKRLGWHVDALPRAVRGCLQDERCGYCGFGCRVGAKQSSMRTFLEDASKDGARIIVDAEVEKVLIQDGRATGVQIRSKGAGATINARAVVVAGGAIESPALLLRSGLGGQVGRNLHLHPGTAAWGVFDDDVRMWEGTLQARYSAELRDRDGGYGPIFETVPVHPGSGSSAVPWVSAADHRARMEKLDKLSLCAVLPRDRTNGRIKISKDGRPRIHYKLNAADERAVTEGVVAAGKVLQAAGAREIYTIHWREPLTYFPGASGSHDKWAEQVRKVGYGSGKTTLFSFHQMSSCRMGTDPASSAVGPDNESHEVRDLFVVDSSTFPTASGVNPMLSIYGIAHRAAGKIAARLS